MDTVTSDYAKLSGTVDQIKLIETYGEKRIPQIEDRREQAIQSLMGLVRDFRKQGEPFAHALNQALDTFSDFRLGTARQEMRRELGRRFGQRSDFRKGRETKPIKRSRDE